MRMEEEVILLAQLKGRSKVKGDGLQGIRIPSDNDRSQQIAFLHRKESNERAAAHLN